MEELFQSVPSVASSYCPKDVEETQKPRKQPDKPGKTDKQSPPAKKTPAKASTKFMEYLKHFREENPNMKSEELLKRARDSFSGSSSCCCITTKQPSRMKRRQMRSTKMSSRKKTTRSRRPRKRRGGQYRVRRRIGKSKSRSKVRSSPSKSRVASFKRRQRKTRRPAKMGKIRRRRTARMGRGRGGMRGGGKLVLGGKPQTFIVKICPTRG